MRIRCIKTECSSIKNSILGNVLYPVVLIVRPSNMRNLKHSVPMRSVLVAKLTHFAAGQQGPPAATEKALDEALVLVQAGQLSQAKQKADEVRGQSPSEGIIQNQLGKVYEKLGDLRSAEEAYQKAIQLEPETEDYYLDLTSLLFLQE